MTGPTASDGESPAPARAGHGLASCAPPSYAAIDAAVRARGLRVRGGFHPTAEDAVPDLGRGRPAATLLLLGNVGSSLWAAFAGSGFDDGRPDPLDDWSRAEVGALGNALGARALFPFDGPPFHPFLGWAQKAERVWPSRMGPLIHAEYGLWHAYRGALAFAHHLALPGPGPGGGGEVGRATRPCARCDDAPCLGTCPVDAVHDGRYDVPRCVDYLVSAPESDCMRLGCRARRACPVGREHVYRPAQARLHMRAFVRSNRPRAGKPSAR